MAVTPAEIAVELGRTAPYAASAEYAQWELWIADARDVQQVDERHGALRGLCRHA